MLCWNIRAISQSKKGYIFGCLTSKMRDRHPRPMPTTRKIIKMKTDSTETKVVPGADSSPSPCSTCNGWQTLQTDEGDNICPSCRGTGDQSETPLTDAAAFSIIENRHDGNRVRRMVVDVELAEELEKELAASKTAQAAMAAALESTRKRMHRMQQIFGNLTLAHKIQSEAAQAVVDRWETPLWKDAEPTAAVIYRLRDTLSNVRRQVSMAGGNGESQRMGVKALGMLCCQHPLCLNAELR